MVSLSWIRPDHASLPLVKPFAPAALPAFFATTASADFSSALAVEISPGKVQNLFPRAVWLYLMRLDDYWALLFPASSPPAPRPHCQFVYLRSKVCSPLLSASPRGYALRFTTSN